ncbi:MAG: apolipoprotein N-acyltransferase [Alphaproteobacteria bacterium]|nr:apolipoprotein N-acyltransferase [Alphaproteobacteria bacterium]
MPEGTLVRRVRPGSRVEAPLCRLARYLAGTAGWRRYGLAFLLGICASAALPPVDLTPMILVAFTGLIWLDDGSVGPWGSFRLGYVFGFGFFVSGLYWIAAAMFVDIASFWWLVPVAALGLPAAFALYIGAALLATNLAVTYLRLPAAARIFAFAVAWTIAECVRGHAFTGLPWNLIGYVWSGGFPGAILMLQSVSVVGIYGLSFLTVLTASLPALLGATSLAPLSRTRRCAPAIAAGLFVAVPSLLGAIRLAATPTVETGVFLRVVQPSIPQTMKWDPAAAQHNFRLLLDLSSARTTRKLAAVLWPEAATPFLLGRDAYHRREAAGVVPEHGYLITGAVRTNPPPDRLTQVWNSVEAVDENADIVARYDKAHLVPFGEYVPLRDVLPLQKITPGTLDYSAGPGPRTIDLPGLPPFAPLICYEVIFPGAIVDEHDRPAWILNVTNDAWYGRSSGPYQHFAIARTRAVEEGLPLVRVANNGVSGIVDEVGRVVARIDLDTVGYADLPLPAVAVAPTLYARYGDWLLLALLCLGLLPVAFRLR